MSRAAGVPALLVALALAFPAAAERTVTIDGDSAATGCSGVHIHFGDRVTARGEETVTPSRAEAKGLVLEGSRHGGITARGGGSRSARRAVASRSRAPRALAPLSCRAAACDGARRQDGNRTRLLEMGSESAVVKLSTVNGPVSIVASNRS